MPGCLLPYLVQHIVILVKGAKSFFFSSSLVSREVLPDQYYIFLKIFSKRGRVKSKLKIVANSRRPFWHKIDKKVRQKIVASMFKTRGSETFWKIHRDVLVRPMYLSMHLYLYPHVFTVVFPCICVFFLPIPP